MVVEGLAFEIGREFFDDGPGVFGDEPGVFW